MRRTAILVALAALAACAAAPAAVAPAALKNVVSARSHGTVTIGIELNRAWKNTLLAPGSGAQLQVLYEMNGDGKVDYTGNVVFRQKALTENISGHGNRYEPVPVKRPAVAVARFTHAVDALYTGVAKPGKFRLAVQLRVGTRVSRLPVKGWYVLPDPR